jgi:type I restriction enzyme S subunit
MQRVLSGAEAIAAIEETSVGMTMINLNQKGLRSLQTRLPCADEQNAIANLLFDMDADAAALNAKLAKARAIKQGMMQRLLTGRMRLI